MKKCKYLNNATTSCSLMLDDLSPTATTIDGSIHPWNDWGFLANKKGGLFDYFERVHLTKYPETKGTFFIPLGIHAFQNKYAGYHIFQKPIDKSFKYFVDQFSPSFDLAFHGLTHGKYNHNKNPNPQNNWIQEFEYLSPSDISELKQKKKETETLLGISFHGGKYPGYLANKYSSLILEELGFEWWCTGYEMMNKKTHLNNFSYFGKTKKILNLPTNISGASLSKNIKPNKRLRNIFSAFESHIHDARIEAYLQYLFDNQLPITIQEHFQTQRTDGVRQQPNIFDDINSLARIYELIRKSDIWHATCNEVSNYRECYDHSTLQQHDDGTYELSYTGRSTNFSISISSKHSALQDTRSNKVIHGHYKQGNWIFSKLPVGLYREL